MIEIEDFYKKVFANEANGFKFALEISIMYARDLLRVDLEKQINLKFK